MVAMGLAWVDVYYRRRIYLKHTWVKSAQMKMFRVLEGRLVCEDADVLVFLLPSRGGVALLRLWRSAIGRCYSKSRISRDAEVRDASP